MFDNEIYKDEITADDIKIEGKRNEKLNQVKEEEDVNEEHVEDLFVSEEQQTLFDNLLQDNLNPLQAIVDQFPNQIPPFEFSFLSDLLTLIQRKQEGWFELLLMLIRSNQSNLDNLVSLGLLSDLLIPDIPESFEIIDEVLTKASSPTLVDHFVSLNGLGELVFYSNEGDKQIISHLFYLISKNTRINYDMLFTTRHFPQKNQEEILFETNEEKEINAEKEHANIDNNSFFFELILQQTNSEPRNDEKEEKIEIGTFLESPSYPFIFLVENLLQSGDLDTVLNTLHGIKRMFKYNQSSISTICSYLIDNFLSPAEESEINLLLFQILRNAYRRDFPISIEDPQFIKVRNEAIEIIEAPDADEKLIVAAIDTLKSMITNSTHQISPIILFNDTNLFQTLIERSPDFGLLPKKATIEFLHDVLVYSKQNERNSLIQYGFIRTFCDYSDTNNPNIIEMVFKCLYILMNCAFADQIPTEDSEKIVEFIDHWEDETIEGERSKAFFEAILQIFAAWKEEE